MFNLRREIEPEQIEEPTLDEVLQDLNIEEAE